MSFIAPPTLLTWLAEISLISFAAIIGCWIFHRRPAYRHAIALTGLLLIAIAPLLMLVGRHLQIKPVQLPEKITHVVDVLPISPPSHFEKFADQGIQSSQMIDRHPSWDFFGFLGDVWFCVGMLLLIRTGIGWHRTWRLARHSSPCERVADPRVRVSDQIGAPISVGLLRPIVLLPRGLVDRLTPDQLDEVLIHEMAHIRRHDHLIAAVQQTVAAVMWPHPLVHVLNRQLNQSREELCDNEVLSNHDSTDYAATLLAIAQWMGTSEPPPTCALSLLGQHPKLAHRIQKLLDERRLVMTHANRKSLFILVVVLMGVGVCGTLVKVSRAEQAASPLAATTQPADETLSWHDISFELGLQNLKQGDQIEIKSFRCSAAELQMGELIQVKGTYDLTTSDQADLCQFLTATDGNATSPIYPQERITVKRGHGEFTLREPISCHGWPHVTFYDKQSGNNIGGVYFGYGQWLNKDTPAGVDHVSGSK